MLQTLIFVTSKDNQNGPHFAVILKKFNIMNQIWLQFVLIQHHLTTICSYSASIQVMPWYQIGDKPLIITEHNDAYVHPQASMS